MPAILHGLLLPRPTARQGVQSSGAAVQAIDVLGYYRAMMRRRFPKKLYGQRWQAETAFSMIKRRPGEPVRAVSYHAQCRSIG